MKIPADIVKQVARVICAANGYDPAERRVHYRGAGGQESERLQFPRLGKWRDGARVVAVHSRRALTWGPAMTAEQARDLQGEMERWAGEAIRLLLSTPEISDCDPRDKDEETHVAERAARAALARTK